MIEFYCKVNETPKRIDKEVKMEVVEKLDRIAELAWETRRDWSNPRNNMREVCHYMREICHLVDEIKEAGYLPVELVQLEVLTPEEIDQIIWEDMRGQNLQARAKGVSQATIAKNSKRQLYKRKE